MRRAIATLRSSPSQRCDTVRGACDLVDRHRDDPDYSRLSASIGPAGAIVGASLLFGAMHLLNYVGTPARIVAGALLISCIGVVFGALYELADNLAVLIAVPAIYDVVLVVASYLAL